MSDWPIGLSTGCFYRESIFDCLETLRDGGFTLLEICSFPKHLDYHDVAMVEKAARKLEQLGIEAYSFHAPFADHIDISSLDGNLRDQALREILQAAEAAASLRVRYFVIHPGPEHAQHPPAEELLHRLRNVVNVLNRVADRCHELGITLVLENKLPHLLFGNAGEMLWILGEISSLEVGACLDTGHAFLSEDLHHLLHKLSGHLKMIHAHDNRSHGDDHLAPGKGNIDWLGFVDQLRKTRFGGAIILELAGGRPAAELLEEARQARLYLRRLVQAPYA